MNSGNIVQQFTEAAAAAIAEQAPDLERDPDSVRGLTLELAVARNRAIEASCFLERRYGANRHGVFESTRPASRG